MKNLILTITLILALKTNTFAQTNFPFDVLITGKGIQAIIFIPGFSCSGDVWNETVKIFEPDFRCYVLTMPGFAGVKPQANPDFHDWIELVAKYIKEKNIEKPIIAGHSLGGGMALALAAGYPELVSKIVVVDALPSLASLFNPAFKADENDDCSQFINNYKSMSEEELYQTQKTTMTQLLADTSMSETIIHWALTSDRNTLGQIICQFMNTDLRNVLGKIKCPSLILLEHNFEMMSPQIETQYNNLKQADIRYATKGLHFIMFDDKEWYLTQLKQFVK
jgi:pimeloyl-ACP methyl ester carboxylesterase